MFSNLTGWHAIIILAVVVLLFGAAKLPALAKSVGQSMRILRSEVEHSTEPTTAAPSVAAPSTRVASDESANASSSAGVVSVNAAPIREAAQA
ncbi:twin-arginine translocase TatA/TatE family subunit [Cumulibacter soli]|uniref:twin-arginine translocase TatA/TatE family subunit n=1 Tax=Cumulibacter soli TaxID=2546344 RepID=UPI0010685212|nr:twin-arginine translocase TatA/TatE family subunit [Cumulibacter soli]